MVIPTVLGKPNQINKIANFETVEKAEQKQQITLTSVSLFAAGKRHKKTAAPMAVGNGSTFIQEKASYGEGAYQSSVDDAINSAALWLSLHRSECPDPIIPFVRERFSLTILQAIDALKLAHEIKWRAV